MHNLVPALLLTLPLREPKGKNCGLLIQVHYPEVNVQKTFSILFLKLSCMKALLSSCLLLLWSEKESILLSIGIR